MEEQQKLEVINNLFQEPGWALLYEQLMAARNNLGDIRNINSIEQLHYNRGRIQQLDELANFPEMVRLALEGNDAL